MSAYRLICPTCGEGCDRLWAWRYCMFCWYVRCGGDQAPDFLLESTPCAWIDDRVRQVA